jgi:TolB-like protein/DNA-binding winged helix-turn-helix (wHTH) protein
MIYRFGDCILDTNLYTLQRGGQTFRLRLKVFRMCHYLLEHRDRVVSREELCGQVWPGQVVSQATLEGVIRLVRQAVGDSGRSQSIIQTLHGHGYRFVAPVEASPEVDPPSGEAPTVALPRNAGMAVLPQDGEPPGDSADDRKPELATDSGLLEQSWHASSAAHGPGTNGGAMSSRDNRWQASSRRRWRWWLARLGLAPALIGLVVLGGWAISWAVRAQGPGLPEKSRIAVLPFIDLSAEAEHSYIGDGFTEHLIAELARIPGLKVIARTSVMKYKGSLKDVATIGYELRVGTVVEGSVRRVGTQVRISAQLIDVASQSHLWSQEYDRELTDVGGIYSDIAIRVAQWLKVQSTDDDVNDCLRAGTQSTALVHNLRAGQ